MYQYYQSMKAYHRDWFLAYHLKCPLAYIVQRLRLKPPLVFDLILCNITLNHLIDNFNNFKKMSSNNTELIISGFYKDDLKKVNRELKKYNFDFIDYKEKNNWVSSRYFYNLNC